MKLTGRILNASIDFITGKPQMLLELNEKNDFKDCYDELGKVEKLSIEIKKFRPKRSLDANAYMWTLLDKLSEKMNIPKIELYRESIKNIGGNSETVCVKNTAVDKLRNGWEHNGLGWQTDTFPSKIDGCTNVILYYGSSTYDSAQMQQLINCIIQDCKAVGIQTETPEQIALMTSMWEGK